MLLVIFMTGLMIWPWQALVEPLGEAMKLVKTEYCGYNQVAWTDATCGEGGSRRFLLFGGVVECFILFTSNTG